MTLSGRCEPWSNAPVAGVLAGGMLSFPDITTAPVAVWAAAPAVRTASASRAGSSIILVFMLVLRPGSQPRSRSELDPDRAVGKIFERHAADKLRAEDLTVKA